MTKKIYSTILPMVFSLVINAQIVESKKPGDDDHVFEKVSSEASTDPRIWTAHVKRSIELPDSVLKNISPGTYTVKIQFIVDIHGNVGQIKAKNDPGYGLAQKAIKIVSSYKGKWQPANQCGRNVKAYKEQPITFVISNQ